MKQNFGIWNAHKDCDNLTISTKNTKCVDDYLLGVGLFFDVFSILGSLLIVWTFWAYQDQRTRARLFLLFIAICDFFTSASYAVALIWSLINPDFSICTKDKSLWVLWGCIIESWFDMYFPLCSFFWTVVLAFHILFLFFGKTYFKEKSVFVCLLIVGWGLPLLTTTAAFFLNVLGPGPPTSTAGWCFINYYIMTPATKDRSFHWLFEFAFAKMWDLAAMVTILVLYAIIVIRLISRRVKNVKFTFTAPDWKLIFIPIVFFILRIWGDTRWLVETILSDKSAEFSVTCGTNVEKALAYLQVVGDPGQGWANAILYIWLTQSIRERLVGNLKNILKRVCCCCCCYLLKMKSSTGDDRERERLVNARKQQQKL